MLRTARSALVAAALAALLVLVGCGQVNTGIGLRGAAILPALAPTEESTLDGTPSLTDPGRRDWPLVKVRVPVHQVEHQPTYVYAMRLNRETARQRGDFPTAEEALRLERNSAAHAAESALEAFSPVVSLVRAPAAMIARGRVPGATVASPDEPFIRLPSSQMVKLADAPRLGTEQP